MYALRKVHLVGLSALLVISFLISRSTYATSQETEDESVVKRALVLCPELRELIRSDDWLENLANPVLTTEQEIRRTERSYKKILDCLSYLESEADLPDFLKTVMRLVEYFIIFAGTSDSNLTKRELVNLEDTTDPAIVQIRDKVSLPPPKGFVYLRYYPSKIFMPKIIQTAFKSENTNAVTILSRYIAILQEPTVSLAEEQLKKRNLPKIVSHEMVHAYINSSLGLLDHSKLPLWFHEGCAIYFSGSGGSKTVIDFTGIVYTTTDPIEYKEYKIIFKYIESKLGKENLYRLIKRSIEGRTTDEMLTSVGAASFEELFYDAKVWHSTRQNIKWGTMLLILIVIAYKVWRKLPRTMTYTIL